MMEYTSFPYPDGEVKRLQVEGSFKGHAAVYNRDLVGDIIEPGAFINSINRTSGKVQLHWGHPSWLTHESMPIGLSDRLAEDERGLVLHGSLATGTAGGRNAWEFLKFAESKAFHVGLSIGYMVDKYRMEGATRVLQEVDVKEISLVGQPANPSARVEELKSVRDIEAWFRSIGYSKKEARRLINLARGEAPDTELDGFKELDELEQLITSNWVDLQKNYLN